MSYEINVLNLNGNNYNFIVDDMQANAIIQNYIKRLPFTCTDENGKIWLTETSAITLSKLGVQQEPNNAVEETPTNADEEEDNNNNNENSIS